MEQLDINQVLNEAPSLLATEAEKVIVAKKLLAEAEQNLSVAIAMATIQYKDEKNASITKAYVELDPKVQEYRLLVIQLEAAMKIANIKHDKIENEWISVRKLCGLAESELRAQKGNTYSPPYGY